VWDGVTFADVLWHGVLCCVIVCGYVMCLCSMTMRCVGLLHDVVCCRMMYCVALMCDVIWCDVGYGVMRCMVVQCCYMTCHMTLW